MFLGGDSHCPTHATMLAPTKDFCVHDFCFHSYLYTICLLHAEAPPHRFCRVNTTDYEIDVLGEVMTSPSSREPGVSSLSLS